MAGSDTVRGIGYQGAQAVLAALDVLDEQRYAAMRVEGIEDVADIEFLSACGSVLHAKQIKTRVEKYTWGPSELVAVLNRWARTPNAADATFEFLTDGRFGPSGSRLRNATEAAINGDPHLLECLAEDDPSFRFLLGFRVRVRRDPSTIGELLLRAEHEVAARFTEPLTVADAQSQAEGAVGRLFQLLLARAGISYPEDRSVSRQEIARCLGVPDTQGPSERWPGSLRPGYVEACLQSDAATNALQAGARTVLACIRADDEPDLVLRPLLLTEGRGSKVLSGQTGTGKTVAMRQLRVAAAEDHRVVVVVLGDAYVPTRLAGLVADGVSEVLGRMLPAATGRQLLADSSVTVVIDNASEISESLRSELASDLRPLVMSNRAATVVLVGRDVAALRELLPASAQPTIYSVVPLTRDRRREMVDDWVADQGIMDDTDTILRWMDTLLSSAVENPLLFTMALRLSGTDISQMTRAELYQQTVERLAVDSGTSNVSYMIRALGVVFADLLNEERRHADPYRWYELLRGATARIRAVDQRVDVVTLDQAARRSGLVAPVGNLQLIAPIHDSFADFFAGTAHARGVPLPAKLRQGDRQRVLFTCELSGVSVELAKSVVGDLPFDAPAAADLEENNLDDESPRTVTGLLRSLSATHQEIGVLLCRIPDGRIAATTTPGMSSWVDYATVLNAAQATGHIVCNARGALDLAVKLWRQSLSTMLRAARSGLGGRYQTNIEDAVTLVRTHTDATAQAVLALIPYIAPHGHADALKALLGPLGITALVYPQRDDGFGRQWPVRYHTSSEINVTPASPDSPEPPLGGTDYGSRTTVEDLTRLAPSTKAAEDLASCINTAVGRYWL